MWLSKAAHFAERAVRRISSWTNSVGIGILAVMMFLTFADVLLRYVFNRPITGAYELIAYMMAITVPLGIIYCGVAKGHIVVDLVVSRFSQRTQAIIDSVTCLIGLGLFSLITWQCGLLIKERFDLGLTSAALLIPVFPFVGVVALSSAIFCLVLLSHLLQFLSRAVRK